MNNYSLHYFSLLFIFFFHPKWIAKLTNLTNEIMRGIFQMRSMKIPDIITIVRVEWSELRYRYCKNKIFKVVT